MTNFISKDNYQVGKKINNSKIQIQEIYAMADGKYVIYLDDKNQVRYELNEEFELIYKPEFGR
jgi:hypothetical protein